MSFNSALFAGLYIEDKWDWERKFPVIRISFGGGSFRTEEQFDKVIYDNLKRNQRRLTLTCEDPRHNPDSCFGELIELAHERYCQKTVILIDE